MHWPVKKLGDVATVFNGKTPSRDEQRESGHPVLKIKDVDERGFFKGVFESFVDETMAVAYSEKTVKSGDTLILNAAHNADYVGSKQFYACNEVDGALATGEWCIVRANQDILDKQYASFFLQSSQARHEVRKLVKGIHLYPKDVARLQIPLPALATQKHIARVLEQADQLRKQAQQMESELNQLAQSLFLEMFGDPVANPFNWKESTLGDSCRKITDGTHHSPPLISEGVPYITAKHLKEWGLDFFSDPTYVSQESHEQIYSRCAPEQGDVLYIKDGATTGIAALNEYGFQFSMLSSLALLKPDRDLLLSTYLCHWLNSPKVKTVMLSNMAGAGITRLTLTKIKDAKILLPPVEKQKQFEARLRQIHSLTRDAKKRIRSSNEVFQALMQRAFNGELTAPERKAA